MANAEHLEILKQGKETWNKWAAKHKRTKVDLSHANLVKARLDHCDLTGADLSHANLRAASLWCAKLTRADLRGANCRSANIGNTDLRKALLEGANLWRANLYTSNLSGAKLAAANLRGANLRRANLSAADLTGADLNGAALIDVNLRKAKLSHCRIYGISAWNVDLKGAEQHSLVITNLNEHAITVDNLEVAQFVYLLLNNNSIRDMIDTIGSKGVLILGRFTDRKFILDAIRAKLRRLGYLPIVFDFERPTDRDFTETVMTLAGMSRFIIADITKPKSVPLELEATVPNYMIPFVPIIEQGEKPFAMFQDLWKKYREWVLDPLEYDTAENLVSVLDKAVIEPANERFLALRARKAEQLVVRHAKDYQKPRR